MAPIALWAYTGDRNWSATYAGSTMSTVQHVTADFPATYISGGNDDSLTWLQSVPMSQRLQELGVDVTDRFWPANHSTELPHEYPFKLDYPEAQRTLQDTLQFLRSVT